MPSSLQTTFPVNGTFPFRGFSVRFHEAGQGPAMILLHNGGTSHFIWQHQIGPFAQSYRVLALDLLGFGESGRPCEPFTLDLYVQMLEALIQAKNLDRPILMGNCIGAAIALEYARHHPGKVAALILANLCGGQSMMRYFHPYMFSKEGLHSDRYYRWLFLPSKWKWMRRQIINRLYGKQIPRHSELYQELLAGINHPQQRQSRLMLIKGLASFSKFDHYQRSAAKLPPIYLCWGERNRVLPLRRGQHLREHLQPDQWATFPKQGHLLMAEAPDQFNAEVRAFLAQHAGGSPLAED